MTGGVTDRTRESRPMSSIELPLHHLHESHGARFGEFAGYQMPMRYDGGAVAEHEWCRSQAALFDVSHMGVIRLRGDQRAEALEQLVPAAISELAINRGRYTFFTNDQGGVTDDLMVTNRGDHLQLVVNAGTKHDDLAHLRSRIGDQCEISDLEDSAILALQGPLAMEIMCGFDPELATTSFGWGRQVRFGDSQAWVSRSGYTGEDGVELILPNHDVASTVARLLSDERVQLAGLAARDSLRLEAGLCLFGHDLAPDISPIEAGLTWAIQKRRRTEGGFIGADVIMDQIANGTTRTRVGLRSEKRPVREDSTLHDTNDNEIGFVSSGGFGPTFDGPIAMGFVQAEFSEVGTSVMAVQRGKEIPMTVSSLPFVPHNYYRG